MRVLVYPHDLELGGSSINAIDLAAAVRDRGHDVRVIAQPGPLADRVAEKGLSLTTMHVPTRPRPYPGAVRAIRAAVRRHGIDLVHTYEFSPCLEAYFGVGALGRVPVVGTIMTMGFADYLPRTIPLTLGYRDLLDEARHWQRAPVQLLEPPVDTSHDRPGVDTTELVKRHHLIDRALNVVIVSRIAVHMKQESIERAVDAVGGLAARFPVRLLVVGGGSAFAAVQARAARVNEAVGRRAVVLTGPLADPRSAYELADVVVGMGSSALRAMAFGKPVIVVGERGFSCPVTPETLAHFERAGFYGVGTGRPRPEEDRLRAQLVDLLADHALRQRLGEFGRGLVDERFSLVAAAGALEGIYQRAVRDGVPRGARVRDTVSTARRLAAYKARDGGTVSRLRPLLAAATRW